MNKIVDAMEHADYHHHRSNRERSRAVDHRLAHPNLPHTAHGWSSDQALHVAVAYSNPCRWAARRKHFNDFRRHMASLPNVVLHVGELAYGDRPFEVTSADHCLDHQFRTRDELWHKENILNAVIAKFPVDWEYGAYVDGDFHFTRMDIALETIQQLQHHDWAQMFSTYGDLSPDHRPMRVLKSFAYRWVNGELPTDTMTRAAKLGYDGKPGRGIGTTGAAWAFRRAAFNAVGGLLDTCILGSADWHMAFGLTGEPDCHPQTSELLKCGRAYGDAIKAWQTRAAKATRKNVGVVDCFAVHYFHGSKSLRGYGDRWKILRDSDYDPYRDIHRDWQGIYQLAPDRPRLRDQIRRYFRSRNEDDISLRGSDSYIAA